jgi:cytochrome c oxidase assembly factor CtaG
MRPGVGAEDAVELLSGALGAGRARVASVIVLVFILVATIGYAWALRRARRDEALGVGAGLSFGVGLAIAAAATTGPMATYVPVLFWVRALQVLLLLYVAPFLLAMGKPLTALAAVSDAWAQRVARFVQSAAGRLIGSPWPTSLALMVMPWLLYFTPWYVTSMSGPVAGLTQILLLLLGFAYFYARLQADPVAHPRTPLVSIGVSVAEGLADGLLGVVLWLGPLVAVDYYAGVGRTWGPSMRVDQSIGAGILWIVGDVFGLVFVLVLMGSLGGFERVRAAAVDAELESGPVGGSTLWWKDDPQLGERFGR